MSSPDMNLWEDMLKIVRGRDLFVFLDTTRVLPDEHRSYLFTRPLEILTAYGPEDVASLHEAIERALSEGLYVAGWWSYEWGYALIPCLHHLLDVHRPPGPLVWLGVFEKPRVWDLASTPDAWSVFRADSKSGCYQNLFGELSEPEPDIGRTDFQNAVHDIQEYIRQGDTYQVNYTIRTNFSYTGNPLDLYQQLRSRQKVSYGAVIRNNDRWTISLSPELFFHRHGSRIWSKPMKGTMKRGRNPEKDMELIQFLRHDRKNQAENVMIVDLLRNDLGRLSVPGSVAVPQLFHVEEYDTLFQMISRIESELRPNTGWQEIFQALFPCGSITGAPKIRTMEIIAEIEKTPRGIYTGAIGFISPHDHAILNVAIRTIELRGTSGVMGIGSGITIGSDPALEYEETRLKALFLKQCVKEK